MESHPHQTRGLTGVKLLEMKDASPQSFDGLLKRSFILVLVSHVLNDRPILQDRSGPFLILDVLTAFFAGTFFIAVFSGVPF